MKDVAQDLLFVSLKIIIDRLLIDYIDRASDWLF